MTNRLLVYLPALNEEATLAQVIGRVPRSVPGVSEVEVLVVDDGSTDRTVELARAAGATVISHGTNRGVGAAFHSAVREAIARGSDILVSIDADGQFRPEDIPLLVAPVAAGQADFVTASRFKDPARTPKMPAMKLWGNHRMSWLVGRLTGRRFADVSCGFRAYGREALLRLTLFGAFTYTQEVFLDLAFKGMRILEVPVEVRGEREFGKSRVASSLWNYAFRTSSILLRTFRDYQPLTFFTALSIGCSGLGLAAWVFLGLHYVQTQTFSPHKWAAFAGAFAILLGLLTFVTGLVADMLVRLRKNQEEILYRLRREESRRDPS
ncbi:MAG: glycosyltransferase [Planctomycetes bacterium]|nr:glycosyltransferase [Planctomycetota bacterium]